jgi:hypothetical protein
MKARLAVWLLTVAGRNAGHDSVGLPEAIAQPPARVPGTDPANPAIAPERIEVRKVYRMSLFARGRATYGTASG